jgi:DNA modification methylase
MNQLFIGDNLDILRQHIASETVDLIYLDPPFNSSATYNRLFKGPTGESSQAQIRAFEDTWHWGAQAAREFEGLLHQPNTDVAEMMRALRKFLGDNDMMAYLTMMASRLLELHRVLKSTGSLYLHCDPTASHYIKVVLDGVFGKTNYRSEISWRRQTAHNDAKQGRRQPGNVRDVLLFYTKSNEWKWNWVYTPYSTDYVNDFYKFTEPETGRRYQLGDLTAPGGSAPEKRNPYYEFMGVRRYWRFNRESMDRLRREGRIVQTAPGRVPRHKRYLDEMPGVAIQNDWNDIRPVAGGESLGYQTQKPLALLERIIRASSNEGDLVLDPFCGCGTAIEAAQRLNRRWIGIDITSIATDLVKDRLRRAFPGLRVDEHSSPKDMDAAQSLAARDKYEFQYWACSLVGAQPYQQKKKGADGGIDGIKYFIDDTKDWKSIIVSVKSGNVSAPMIRDLRGVLEREKAAIALFVTLAEPTKPMEIEALKAGFYADGTSRYQRIQIVTIKSLLDGAARAQHPGVAFDPARSTRARPTPVEQRELFTDTPGRTGEVVELIQTVNSARGAERVAPMRARTKTTKKVRRTA